MDKIRFYFDVMGENFEPEELKQMIGLETIIIKRIGDKRLIGKWETNYLSLRNQREILNHFSNQLIAFVSILETKMGEVKKYVEARDLRYDFTAEVLKKEGSKTEICVEPAAIKKLAQLNCLIVFDIMG